MDVSLEPLKIEVQRWDALPQSDRRNDAVLHHLFRDFSFTSEPEMPRCGFKKGRRYKEILAHKRFSLNFLISTLS